MIALIGQAFRIFGSNFTLLAGIALLVGMPKAFVQNLFQYFIIGPEPGFLTNFAMGTALELVFGTLMAGALIAALTGIRSGIQLSFSECLASGFRNWSRLFAARLIPFILIDLGIIAFIIPGIILLTKWLFIDYAVVLEQADASAARKRSAELIRGSRWEAFGMLLVLFLGIGIIEWVLSVPTSYLENIAGQKLFLVDVSTRTIMDLVETPVVIMFFLYYWQRRDHESQTHQDVGTKPPPLPSTDAASVQTPG